MEAPAEAGGEQAGDARQLRIALAGPAYTRVAVLALFLLGCPPAPNMGTCAQPEVVFRRKTGHVDPCEWSLGCFKSRDQRLPIFFCPFSMETLLCGPEGQLLAAGKGTVFFEFRKMIWSGLLYRSKQSACSQTKKHEEATRSHVRRLRQREQDKMAGHTRV
jgi:hypothetical protein